MTNRRHVIWLLPNAVRKVYAKKKLCRSLLKYLDRLLVQANELLAKPRPRISINRFKIIEKVKQQQWDIYFGKQSSVPDRIVSLHKPHIRPIVRGKETKPVEIVNKVQIDGLSFIEHISLDDFNEGIRMQSSIKMQERYFGKCNRMGADAIYGTNENRKHYIANNIATCFVAKGKQGEDLQQKS